MKFIEVLPSVVDRVLVAGELLSAEWSRADGPRGAGDKALIDVEIEDVLRAGLLGILDCDFWGEETAPRMTGNKYCWVVDPNDGTADFLQGRPGSAISVGLLYNANPVLGVVYAPITSDRGKDCVSWALGMPSLIRNGQAVANVLSHQRLLPGSAVLVSTGAVKQPALNAELCAPAFFVPMPSIAYRLARVAVGDAVAGVSLAAVSAHDVVGGHALLIGACGVLLNQDGSPIRYDSESRMELASSRCFGGAFDACRQLAFRDWGRLFPKNRHVF